MSKVVQLRNIKRALRLEPSETINYSIAGRVSNVRAYKSVNFIDLIDGSTRQHLQVVAKRSLLNKPDLGSYLICRGNISSSPGHQQDIEFKVNQIELASSCDVDKYPLISAIKNEQPDGWFRKHLHLRPQASHFASLLRVRSELELSLHMIFKQMDFFKVHTPILTANDSEASSDLFSVQRSKQNGVLEAKRIDELEEEDSDEETNPMLVSAAESVGPARSGGARVLKSSYFKKEVYMVTSAQLHLESLAASLSRVYCVSPTFRAENSLSKRHLCEFTMVEAEEANVRHLEPLLDRVESIVKFCAQYTSDISEFSPDFSALLDKYSNHKVYEKLAHSKYIRMTYNEALKIVESLHAQTSPGSLSFELPTLSECHYGCVISRRHEVHLLNHCNNVPIFITNYPKHLKPFYMKCNDSNEAQCFDLIAPFGGEICGGSLREDNLDILLENLRRQSSGGGGGGGGDKALRDFEEKEAHRKFQWYLDLREFGTFPHGGFGIGFERLIQSLLGIHNIKDTIAFPRWAGNCSM